MSRRYARILVAGCAAGKGGQGTFVMVRVSV